MGVETMVTLALVAVLVAVLAVYILAIGFALRKLSFTLGTIVIGLRAIAQQTAPVGAVVGDLIAAIDEIEDALESLVSRVVAAKRLPARGPRASLAARPSTGAGTGDEWDALIADPAVDSEAPVADPTEEPSVGGERRLKARSSGRGSRPKGRSKGSMSDAVARAREKVEVR